jgi:hypothetical protein
MIDSMRGFVNSTTATPSDAYLVANTSAAESTWGDFTGTDNAAIPLATGFQIVTNDSALNGSGSTYIYMAIRRGPMKVPTSGTSVFSPIAVTNSLGAVNTTGFPVDMQIMNVRSGSDGNGVLSTRLLGVSSNTTSSGSYLKTPSTIVETTGSDITRNWNNTGFQTSLNWSGGDMIYWSFGRAPSFFDVVCAAGTLTSNQRISHNLTVVPELIITKGRNRANAWPVYSGSINSIIYLNSTSAMYTDGSYFPWGTSAPTTTDFGIASGTIDLDNFNGVFYLFATCAGVSKVGSYTGTGTTKQIDCGFTGGARLVLIKRTDSTGDWYLWDSARGIVSGNDSYLLLNSTAAEVTSTDYIDTYSAGFEISSTAPAAINASGGSFIFFAVA